MNTRLKQFLSAENISQSQFADTLKVTRASVSHVLSGRNNPGYDFIQEIMTAYPRLNMEWLILGKGKMYKDDIVRHQEYPAEFNDSLFPDTDEYVDRYIPAGYPVLKFYQHYNSYGATDCKSKKSIKNYRVI